MTEQDLLTLIRNGEKTHVEFKQQFHENNSRLLHDILCLSNCYIESSRYLFFGVNDSHQPVGIENDTNRKSLAQLYDLLKAQRLNRLPSIKIHSFVIDGHAIDVFEIENRPSKPYFTLEDRTHRGSTIRAGVSYTRNADTNTSIASTAPEDQIELMWRERFGIGTPPLKRVLDYLDHSHKWIKSRSDEYIYHEDFPEFTIAQGERLNDKNFEESWATQFPDTTAYSLLVNIHYLTTLLLSLPFVCCDGGRYMIPMPKIRLLDHQNREFYVIRNSHSYKIADNIFRQYHNLEETLNRVGVLIYESEADVP